MKIASYLEDGKQVTYIYNIHKACKSFMHSGDLNEYSSDVRG